MSSAGKVGLPSVGVPTNSAIDLLGPGPIRQVRLDLTTRCNLRCVYCAVSQATYVGSDMPIERIHTLTQLIIALRKFHPLHPIDMNGHGETTLLPYWHGICRDFLAHGIDIRLTSNFAKEFDPVELRILARMKGIGISIDTADRRLLRRMRRRVDLRQIITNIHLVRVAAIGTNHKPPDFHFLCGLYDLNALGVCDLARLAISLDVRNVAFWNLTPYPLARTDVPEHDWIRPLDDLPDVELKPRIEAILSALHLLRRNGVSFHVQGNFIETLARRVNLSDEVRRAGENSYQSADSWFDPGLS